MSGRSAPIRANVDPEAAIHRARRLRPAAASALTAKQKPDRRSARLLLVVQGGRERSVGADARLPGESGRGVAAAQSNPVPALAVPRLLRQCCRCEHG